MQDGATGGGWSVPGSLVEQPEAAEGPVAPSQPSGWGTGSTPSGPGQPVDAGGMFAGTGPLAETSTDGSGAADAVPRLDLQPMTVADILDGAFSIIKARPARIFLITAMVVIPLHLFVAWMQRNAFGDEALLDSVTSEDPAVWADTSDGSVFGGGEMLSLVAVYLVPVLGLVFVAACIAHMVAAWTMGRDVPAGELLRVIGGRWWPLLVSFVVVHALELGAFMACWLGLPFVMAFFVVTAPVIGAEGLGPFAALKRALNLSTRRYWPVMGIALLIALVSTLLGMALGGLIQVTALFFSFETGWPLLAAGNILSAVVTTPFVAAATVLLYLDLRVRSEGLDIELAAIDLARDV